jgi:hypothetical protein
MCCAGRHHSLKEEARMRPMLVAAIVCGVFVPALVPAAAQETTVTGVVVDERTGEPLAGAAVEVSPAKALTATDAEGRFTLALPDGRHVVTVSLVGYALGEVPVVVPLPADARLTIRLAAGAGSYTERVLVTAPTTRDGTRGPAETALHGRQLQDLRGVMLDDPLRAVQSLPSVTATDDFYSEFAVRGSGFRHVGLAVDGIPSRYLMHTVHGVTDGGSIAMVNTDTLGAVALLPGSYAQPTGRRIGAHLDLTTRDGSRESFRGRAGLSGTSATLLMEGPLGGRGSWLASARRSYLDLLIRQIDPEANFAFGFTDVQGKVVYDLTPRHQLELLAIAGRSKFVEGEENLSPNDEATAGATTWLSSLTWRFTPHARLVTTQKVYSTGVRFDNRNNVDEVLDRARAIDGGWRTDNAFAIRGDWWLEFGADAQRLSGRHLQQRTVGLPTRRATLADFSESGGAASAYGQVRMPITPRLTLTPGARVDYWGLTDDTAASPWITGTFSIDDRTRLRGGSGLYRQFPEVEIVYDLRGGGRSLDHEKARHADLGIERDLGRGLVAQINAYTRDEEDVLWTRGAEPRRLENGAIVLGRGDAPWVNALEGRARGVEVLLRRDAASGLSGWAAYAYADARYTDVATGERFAADADQRHTVSLYGHYRLGARTSVGTKFRYGSNYPMVGYIAEASAPGGAPLLRGGGPPLFYSLSSERNTLRLPAYARLDVRADRTFTWWGRRATIFAEVANVLNRTNVRATGFDFDRNGRVFGPTEALMPIIPSAGFIIDF